ncbi:MAG: hypothetical protein ACFCU3_06775 [Verrucomicrobiales bacterium]
MKEEPSPSQKDFKPEAKTPNQASASEPQGQTSESVAASRKIPTTNPRDIWLGVLVGVLLFSALGWGVFALFSEMGSRGTQGTIVDKEFYQRPETRISVGEGGLRREERAGVWRLFVRSQRDGQTYVINVQEDLFNSKSVGDSYYFVPAPESLVR